MNKNILLASLAILLLALSLPHLSWPAAANSNTKLAAQVTIRRDTYGIPHILAKTEEAAAFGMGYAQAEDHCIEIARRFVSARGEEAKHLGQGAENDFRLKRFGNYEKARQNFHRPSPLFQRIMNAYAAGFNLYVEQHRAQLPAWIPVFDGVDVFAHTLAGGVRAAYSEAVIRALQAKYPATEKSGAVEFPFKPSELIANLALADQAGLAPLPDSPEQAGFWDTGLSGSNAWALGGSRTTSGKPILLGNPHLDWTSLYWEAQVTVPGKINFFGSTLVGFPVLRAGFNEHLGWFTTNNAPDLTDIFALSLDPDKPDHYLFEGVSRPLTQYEVTVESKESDGKLRSETRTYWRSHLGPIIHRTADKAFAVKSTMLEAYHYFEGFYRLSKTKNLAEFLATMRLNYGPTSNFTYADAAGNILYIWNGRVPRRVADGTSYRLDVPATTGKYVWQELHKLDELPRLLNPSGGYLQNCNDAPWYTSLRDPLEPKHYPPYFEPAGPVGLRTQISLAMLEGQEKFSLTDVQRLKYNTRMLLADRVKPDLLKALKEVTNPAEEVTSGLAVLAAWDNHTSADSRGGVLFQRFWDTYRVAVPQPFATPWAATDPAGTPTGLADPTAAVKHLIEAVRWTRQTYGSERVAWGDVHRFRLGELDLPADGANGAYGLFRVMNFGPAPDGKRVAGVADKNGPWVGGGDGWVMAVEFSRPVKAYSVLAYGQTSNPKSKHSTDQLRLFAEHKLRRVWFTEAEIKANLERSYRPSN